MENELLTKKATDLLKNSQGIFFGEEHGDFATVEWLTDSLPKMKESGVRIIYAEYPTSGQKIVADYYVDRPGSEERLKSYIQDMYSDAHSPGIAMAQFRMMKSAKEQGIKVVFVDNPARTLSSRDRDNAYIADQIKKDQKSAKKDEKYVVYFGAAHSYSGYERSDQITGGIDERLNIPSIDIENSKGSEVKIIDNTAEKKRSSDYEAIIPVSKNQTSSSDKPFEKYSYDGRLTQQEAKLYDIVSENVPKEKWNETFA